MLGLDGSDSETKRNQNQSYWVLSIQWSVEYNVGVTERLLDMLVFQYNIQSVDDSWYVTKDCEKDVDGEIGCAAPF